MEPECPPPAVLQRRGIEPGTVAAADPGNVRGQGHDRLQEGNEGQLLNT